EAPDDRERRSLDGGLPEQVFVACGLPLELDLEPLPVERRDVATRGRRGCTHGSAEARLDGGHGIVQVGRPDHERVRAHLARELAVRFVHVGRGSEDDRYERDGRIWTRLAAEGVTILRRILSI